MKMDENKYKVYHMRTPVENQATAAWADCGSMKDVSGVNIPNEMQVVEAKEYVDENHK